jgi:type III secretion protein V
LIEGVVAYLSDHAAKNVKDWLELEHHAPQIVDLLALICLEVSKAQPAILFGSDQAADYALGLNLTTEEEKPAPPVPVWLREILSRVLDLGISIADKHTVARVLNEGLANHRPTENIAEDLIDALRPEALEIHVQESYLKEITGGSNAANPPKFSEMRDTLFYELGLRLPPIRFVVVDDLKPQGFRFRINHMTTVPRGGVPPTHYLALTSPAELRELNIEARSMLQFTNDYGFSLINASSAPAAVSAGINCFSPMEYLMLSFGVELRKKGKALIYRATVEEELEQLELAFPALVNAARPSISLEQLTRVVRYLIAEQVSIRNLKLILERILEYDYVVSDASKYILFDERLPAYTEPSQAWLHDPDNIATYIRLGLKRYFKEKYAPDGTLMVYTLGEEIERILSEYWIGRFDEEQPAALRENERKDILDAVRLTIGNASPSDRFAVILTNANFRPALHNVTSSEFPESAVLAYEELPHDLSIQSVAKISLKT